MRWFFVLLTIIILAAWPLRWEKGPTQTEGYLKIVHQKDRWTNQSWIVMYGNTGDKVLSGEEVPVPPQKDIEERKKVITVRSSEKISNLKNKIAEQEQIMEKTLNSNLAYNAAIEQNPSIHYSKYDKERESLGIRPLGVSIAEADRIAATKISKREIAENKLYNDARYEAAKLKKELENIPIEIEKQAISELKNEAADKRQRATHVWYFLLGGSFSLTVFSIVLRKMQVARIMPPIDTTITTIKGMDKE